MRHCMSASLYVCVCVYVCVCERERERESEWLSECENVCVSECNAVVHVVTYYIVMRCAVSRCDISLFFLSSPLLNFLTLLLSSSPLLYSHMFVQISTVWMCAYCLTHVREDW